MTNVNKFPGSPRKTERPDPVQTIGQLEGVVGNSNMTTQEKRTVLASWASDANAVPHIPWLRQLPDGSVVNVGEILRALKSLDGAGDTKAASKGRTVLFTQPFIRRRLGLPTWSRYRRGRDDYDDPPPCPAHADIRPKGGGGATFACAEPIPA